MRVLLAGLGSVGQRHARNLRALLGDTVELLAYRVRGLPHAITPERGIEKDSCGRVVNVEAQLGIRAFRSLDAALAERPDVVFVTNPNSLHLPVAMAAASAGCHLFIEKPLADSLDGIEALADLIERTHVVCFVGYQLRFHPAFQCAQAWLAAGTIGRVVAARLDFGEYLPAWHPYEDYRQMHAARRDQGGGVILSQIHDLDCAYALFGLPRRVFAVGGHLSTLDVDVEDTASILMECVRDGRAFPVHLHQDFLRLPKTRIYDVMGDAGRIRLDFIAGTVERFDAAGVSVNRLDTGVQRNELFLDELRHFLLCVRGDAQPIVGVRDGLQSLRMAMAASRSMEQGTVEHLA